MRLFLDAFFEKIHKRKCILTNEEIIVANQKYRYYGNTIDNNVNNYINDLEEVIEVKSDDDYDKLVIDGDVVIFNSDYYHDLYLHMMLKNINLECITENEFYCINSDKTYIGRKIYQDLILDASHKNNLEKFINCLNLIDDIKFSMNLSFNDLTINSFYYDAKNVIVKCYSKSVFEISIGSNKNNKLYSFTNHGVTNKKKLLSLKKDLILKKTNSYIQFKLSNKDKKLNTLIESSYYRYYDVYTFIISCFYEVEFYNQYLNSKELRDIYMIWFDRNDLKLLEKRLSEEGFRRSLKDIESINLFLQMNNISLML